MNIIRFYLVGAVCCSCIAVATVAHCDEVIVVTTTQDVVDFGGQQMAADLPGPDGLVSFREACHAANNSTGPQTIQFAIPTSDWHPLSSQMALLQLEDGPYVISDDETTIDFGSQELFTGDTNPSGKEVGIIGFQPNGLGSPAITVSADSCRVIGLGDVLQRGYALRIVGNFNQVEGCVIQGTVHESIHIDGGFVGPPATGNTIGGTTEEKKNQLESVLIAGTAHENVVIGNEFDGNGIRVEGFFSLDQSVINNRIGGPNPGEGNIFFGAGNFSGEGFPVGSNIKLFETVGTVIEGNQIGLFPDGMTPAVQTAPTGIEVRASLNTVVRNNVVVGMKTIGINHFDGQVFGRAIVIHGACNGTILENNRVGITRSGDPVPNFNGILVSNFQDSPVNTLIGGSFEAGNIIAHSERTGVQIHSSVNQVAIQANQIFGNGLLGIDLNGDGITFNDALDADLGANQLQNFPILTSATTDGQFLQITGELTGSPDASLEIDFYCNIDCDDSGYGEGEFFVGTISIVTDAQGAAQFTAKHPDPCGQIQQVSITATATDQLGNTSEFSECVSVSQTILLGDINGDGNVNLLDVAPFVDLLSTGMFQTEADLNQDGSVNLLDVTPLVALLSGN